jgi:hypothetical protein
MRHRRGDRLRVGFWWRQHCAGRSIRASSGASDEGDIESGYSESEDDRHDEQCSGTTGRENARTKNESSETERREDDGRESEALAPTPATL